MDKKTFKEYFDAYYRDCSIDSDSIKTMLEDWEFYRKLILSKTIDGPRYNSSKANFENDTRYSLEYFIEHDSTVVGSFGSIISGKLVLWIKGKGDLAQWYDRRQDSDGNFQEKLLEREDERKELLNILRDYLHDIVAAYTFEDLKNAYANELTASFGSPAFIVKMAILNTMLKELHESTEENPKSYDYKLIPIYKFDGIFEHDCFKDFSNIENPLELNKEITDEAFKMVGIPAADIDVEALCRMAKCIWSLTNDRASDLILSQENKNIILYGAPGTGKTHLVKKALMSSGASNVRYKIVQFHPGFTYEDFIEGLKPVGMSDGKPIFDVVNGCFKDFCIDALHHPDKEYVFVADEINRANLSSVFGETLSLLEDEYRFNPNVPDESVLRETPLSGLLKMLLANADDKRKEEVERKVFYKTKSGDVLFGIPKNVHFIGMMNDVDKSIDSFDLALRRRFVWIRTEFDETVLDLALMSKGVNQANRKSFIHSCKKLNAYITGCKYGKVSVNNSLSLGKSYEFGHAIFMRIEDRFFSKSAIKKEGKDKLWSEHIEPTLREYLRTNSLDESDIDGKLATAKDEFIKKDE